MPEKTYKFFLKEFILHVHGRGEILYDSFPGELISDYMDSTFWQHERFRNLQTLIRSVRNMSASKEVVDIHIVLPEDESWDYSKGYPSLLEFYKLMNNTELEKKIFLYKHLFKNYKINPILTRTQPIDIINYHSDLFEDIEVIMSVPVEDVNKEIKNVEDELSRLEKQILGIKKKLSNESFVSNAPKDIVESEQKKLTDMNKRKNKNIDKLSNLYYLKFE